MTYAQIWLVSGHPLLVYVASAPIDGDVIQVSPAVVIAAEIDGSPINAEQLRAAMTITNGVLSVAGHSVPNQTTTTR